MYNLCETITWVRLIENKECKEEVIKLMKENWISHFSGV